MIGLIRSDFKKLFKIKSLIICSIIAFIIAILTVYVINMTYHIIVDQFPQNSVITQEEYEELLSSVRVGEDAMSIINSLLSDSSIQIFIAICVCIFVASEYSMGTFKNTISRGFSRSQIYFSKALVSAVASVIISTVYILGVILTALICTKVDSNFNITQILIEFVIYIILAVALSMLFFMTSMLTEKTAIAITVCIAGPAVVDFIMSMFSGVVVNINDYTRFWLPYTFNIVQSSYSNGIVIIPISIALGYIAITYFIGSFVFSKRDIK